MASWLLKQISSDCVNKKETKERNMMNSLQKVRSLMYSQSQYLWQFLCQPKFTDLAANPDRAQ